MASLETPPQPTRRSSSERCASRGASGMAACTRRVAAVVLLCSTTGAAGNSTRHSHIEADPRECLDTVARCDFCARSWQVAPTASLATEPAGSVATQMFQSPLHSSAAPCRGPYPESLSNVHNPAMSCRPHGPGHYTIHRAGQVQQPVPDAEHLSHQLCHPWLRSHDHCLQLHPGVRLLIRLTGDRAQPLPPARGKPNRQLQS
mmetsp:Transcript_120391/g.225043  ORF Transcript_120391/g.225043 Transcript_120391/m.225043 type:complete len:203 (+) Transcript_120391:354-962(+)